jgi:3-phenylpropionate/trans-cinnamate dioxygenase ferredoxin subunit
LKKYQWHKIAENVAETGVTEKGAITISVGGKTICLARFEDKLFGCAQKCPHASGIMSDGWVDAQGNIVCPLHRYKFNLENGRNTTGEGYYLKTYPIEERPDGVFVGIEVSLFGW